MEDVALNRFLTDRPQVLDEWIGRLAVPRRDVGTGMTDTVWRGALRRTKNLRVVQEQLRHVDVQTTMGNTRLTASRRRATNFSPTPRSAKFPN